MLLIRLVVVLVFALIVNSCAYTRGSNYPVHWAQLDDDITSRQCPVLSGFYENLGDLDWADDLRSFPDLDCMHLSFQLLAKDLTYDWKGNPLYECKPVESVNMVELSHTEDTQLQIKLWNVDGKNNSLVHEELLDMSKGDFTCKDGYLTLQSRRVFKTLVVGNFYSSDLPSFSRNQDNWLLMKLEMTRFVHYQFLVLKGKETHWFYWKPIDENLFALSAKDATN